MSEKAIVLQKGKEKAILNRHHWIYSGAVQKIPEFTDGDILPVLSAERHHLGYAYFNRRCSIIGRIISFGKTSPHDALAHNLKRAIALRQWLFDDTRTNAYRLVNGEGDCLPGLIVDRYGDVLVIQISTLGMDRLKSFILDVLVNELSPQWVYEKSNLPSRREEGMTNVEQTLFGDPRERVEIRENSLRFVVDVIKGQKTGFFLDQREMRHVVGQYAAGKKVLNCFSYSGGFSVYALSGGATSAVSVEIAEKALTDAKTNMGLNHFQVSDDHFVRANVFEYLQEPRGEFDFVVLDPPAFAKKKSDVVQACRGYKEINRRALMGMPGRGLLLTCSCSYFVDEKLFQQVVFQAACEADRSVRIIQKHHLAIDHPVNVFHPEGSYLKSLLLYVE